MDNLLLLHGAIGAKSQFAEIEKSLANNFTVNSINFSGHGGKDIPSEPFSIELFANDVLNWLDDNKISRINIFGYSMGGYVGLYLAKNNPEKIGKVFTLATKFKWSVEISSREIKMLDSSKIKEKVPKFAGELKNRHGGDWEIVLEKTRDMMINLGKENTLTIDDYSLIENEVLVGIGDRDKMVTIEETGDVYSRLKNGRLLVLPNTPHPLEQVSVERLVYELKSFFS
ncbi:MAG: alpha/beta fold hydrolase [Chlorobi bacterium]|nr:alpha/beta fold hydrolase [Chlorobiota bacterium]MCI0716072.1 alpha/beta fold hydrolase [Chlorobiota bacterium]